MNPEEERTELNRRTGHRHSIFTTPEPQAHFDLHPNPSIIDIHAQL